MSHSYDEFLTDKTQLDSDDGFEPVFMPEYLFDFQRAMVDWSLRKGRAALFEDCGMGKSPQSLVWGENIVRHTNLPVLLLTPLAVGAQMEREAEKFNVDAKRCRDGVLHGPRIYIANYEKLHYFNPQDFAGVICDESSILKSFDGTTRAAITEFMRTRKFRLLGTATAAPNDYVELGTSSEALGYLGHMDMLNRFFKNSNNTVDTKGHWRGHAAPHQFIGPHWRFRGHAEQPFWRWVCSWARSLRKPSDLGFDDTRFQLPPLIEHEHTVKARRPREGMLFSMPAIGLAEEREERRRTIQERCEMAASLVTNTGQPAICWCHLNDEGDLLEKLIPGCVQVSGKDSDDAKEEKLLAFASNQVRVLVSKPIIGAWGLNLQNCAHMTSFASHSFEQMYQSIRRCWRFGQTRPVVVDHIISDGEGRALANLRRKAEQMDKIFSEIVLHMQNSMGIARSKTGAGGIEVPAWL